MAKRKGLGRRFYPDERDAKYRMRAILPREEVKRPTRKTHLLRWYGDQGTTSECTGYSGYGYLRASPVANNIKGVTPTLIYHEAQKRDEWPGEDYEGSSVRAVMKYYAEMGYIGEYRSATTVAELIDWMGTRGPVILGINWYRKMFTPTKYGYVIPDGPLDGGHAILAIGYDDDQGTIKLHNSWGKSWGLNGRCVMSYDVVERLLGEDGEAWAAVEIKQPS